MRTIKLLNNTIMHAELIDVHSRLSELGLTLAALQEAVNAGYLARTRLTLHHPRIYWGYVFWAETVAELRNQLRVQGWDKTDNGNYERTVNPEKDIAIVVTTGDGGTGCTDLNASNRNPKGTNTVDAIEENICQLSLPILDNNQSLQQNSTSCITWILLVHVAKNEIRSELSIPSKIEKGKILSWKERIILPATPRDDDGFDIDIDYNNAPPLPPEIDIPVMRRL